MPTPARKGSARPERLTVSTRLRPACGEKKCPAEGWPRLAQNRASPSGGTDGVYQDVAVIANRTYGRPRHAAGARGHATTEGGAVPARRGTPGRTTARQPNAHGRRFSRPSKVW